MAIMQSTPTRHDITNLADTQTADIARTIKQLHTIPMGTPSNAIKQVSAKVIGKAKADKQQSDTAIQNTLAQTMIMYDTTLTTTQDSRANKHTTEDMSNPATESVEQITRNTPPPTIDPTPARHTNDNPPTTTPRTRQLIIVKHEIIKLTISDIISKHEQTINPTPINVHTPPKTRTEITEKRIVEQTMSEAITAQEDMHTRARQIAIKVENVDNPIAEMQSIAPITTPIISRETSEHNPNTTPRIGQQATPAQIELIDTVTEQIHNTMQHTTIIELRIIMVTAMITDTAEITRLTRRIDTQTNKLMIELTAETQ